MSARPYPECIPARLVNSVWAIIANVFRALRASARGTSYPRLAAAPRGSTPFAETPPTPAESTGGRRGSRGVTSSPRHRHKNRDPHPKKIGPKFAPRFGRKLALDAEPKLSDRATAERCGVSQPFVGTVRTELASYNRCKMRERTVTRGGTTYEQNTSNIGNQQVSLDPRNPS